MSESWIDRFIRGYLECHKKETNSNSEEAFDDDLAAITGDLCDLGDSKGWKELWMDRNQRKLQVLQILMDAKSSMDVAEIANAASIDKHHALVTCLRYQEQGLLQKTGTNPASFCLTARGSGRLEFLISR